MVGKSRRLEKGNYNHMEKKDGKRQSYQNREGGESVQQPILNNSSQLRQGQKTMGLLTGDWRSWEGYSMLKLHESMVENHWELRRMINHMVNDNVTLDIDLRLLDNS